MKTMHQLMATLQQQGQIEWIDLRPARCARINAMRQVGMIAGHGLEGDHTAEKTGGKRQVTLIQAEHLPVIAGCVGLNDVAPAMLRRNLLVSGINLLALQNRQFTIGDVLLKYTGACAPCGLMEETPGVGGYHAMRGHGGITANYSGRRDTNRGYRICRLCSLKSCAQGLASVRLFVFFARLTVRNNRVHSRAWRSNAGALHQSQQRDAGAATVKTRHAFSQ